MKRILIVDDQAAARELVGTILSYSGYETHEAVDGLDAVVQAQRVLPDLILLDIHMPGQDGFAACRVLRADPRFAAVPIVAMTAGLMSGEREKALSGGFTEFLAKPISLALLRQTIDRLLQQPVLTHLVPKSVAADS